MNKKMNVLTSECSSGCDSGWTLYLDQSFRSPNGSYRSSKFVDHGKGTTGFCDVYPTKNGNEENENDEEEDLSMVSDASSGPPHFNEDENYFNDNHNNNNGCFYPSFNDPTLGNNAGKRKKIKETRRGGEKNELPSFLDDTASSPVINFSSKNNLAHTQNQASMESVLDYSQGFSATHFQGRSEFQDHYSFLQSSLSGNQLQNNQCF